jgi:leader peptidase (prepilin peptidase)/N-methyltransferase
LVWLVRLLGFWLLKQEAMGFGDVILMAMIGAFLGWQPTIIAFFIAPACAILVVLAMAPFHRERMIPYGPYLSLGALITILAWQPLFERTRHFFELGVLLVPVALMMGAMFTLSLLLVQGTKRVLGIKTLPPDSAVQWRSGDQTWFFKGEHVNRHTCRWKTRDWDGCASAHGSIHEERWRGNGAGGNARWDHKRSL